MLSRAASASALSVSSPAGSAQLPPSSSFPLSPIASRGGEAAPTHTASISAGSGKGASNGNSSGRGIRTAVSGSRKGRVPELGRVDVSQGHHSKPHATALRFRPGTASEVAPHKSHRGQTSAAALASASSSPVSSEARYNRTLSAPSLTTTQAHHPPGQARNKNAVYSSESSPILGPIAKTTTTTSPFTTTTATTAVTATTTSTSAAVSVASESGKSAALGESKSCPTSRCSSPKSLDSSRTRGNNHGHDSSPPLSALRAGLGSRAASRQGEALFEDDMISSPKLRGAPMASRMTATSRSVRLAKAELVELKEMSHQENSRMLPRLRSLGKLNITAKAKLGSVGLARDDLRRDEAEEWCKLRHRAPGQSLSMSETRTLRKWFMQMDADGSGEVGVDELLEPLLSCGVVRSKAEIRQIFHNAGLDSSGEVCFNDLMKALNKINDARMKSKIVGLQEMCNDDSMETETLLTSERRRLLLKSTIDDTTRRSEAVERVLASSDLVDSRELDAIMKTFTRLTTEQELSMREHTDFIQTLQVALTDQLRALHKYQRENKGEPRRGLPTSMSAFHFTHDVADSARSGSSGHDSETS